MEFIEPSICVLNTCRLVQKKILGGVVYRVVVDGRVFLVTCSRMVFVVGHAGKWLLQCFGSEKQK